MLTRYKYLESVSIICQPSNLTRPAAKSTTAAIQKGKPVLQVV